MQVSQYKPVYNMGDSVKGIWNGVPFRGTVGNDTMINEDEGPYVTVHLYLPIVIGEHVNNFIIVYHKQLRLVKNANYWIDGSQAPFPKPH